jgi:hypothetical protein
MKPNITITVSWIKNLYMRRAALIISLPFCALLALGQAAILWLLMAVAVVTVEPIRRLLEVADVLRGLAPTFKEQWIAKEPS